METVRDRPVLLERYPRGGGRQVVLPEAGAEVGARLAHDHASCPRRTARRATPSSPPTSPTCCGRVNQGCLGFHVWPNRLPDLEVADELRIDLDPSPGIGFAQLQEARGARPRPARRARHRGPHQDVGLARAARLRRPRAAVGQLRGAGGGGGARPRARAPAPRPASPRQWWKEERGSRVFVDFNQNAPHKTVFGAWCVRPRVGAQVSTPITWDELADGRARRAHHRDRARRGSPSAATPWAGMYDRPQDLTPLLERSAHDLANGLMDAPWPPVYPKHAERAAAGRSEPRPHNLTRGSRSRSAGPTAAGHQPIQGEPMTDLEERTTSPPTPSPRSRPGSRRTGIPTSPSASGGSASGLSGWAAPGLPRERLRQGPQPQRQRRRAERHRRVRRARRARRPRAAAGGARRSPPTARRSRSTSTCATSSPARRRGASSSASPAPAPTSPACRPGPSRTATSGSSPARRCGPPAARSPTSACSSPAPTPTCRSTRASPTSRIDMHQPGVEIRPLVEMTGHAMFNEVFLEEASVPDSALIGGLNNGWAVANTTLMNERAGLGSGGGHAAAGAATPGTVVNDLDKRVGDFVVRRRAPARRRRRRRRRHVRRARTSCSSTWPRATARSTTRRSARTSCACTRSTSSAA